MRSSRNPFRRVPNRVVALLLIMGFSQWAAAVQDPFAGLRSLRDEQLDLLRGGFENTQGLQFSFAIERAVVVNGELIASTRLVLNDLSPLLAGGMPNAEIISSVLNIVQNGPGNTISPPAGAPTPPPTTGIAPETPAPGAAPASASAPAIAAAPSQTQAPNATTTPLLVQMNAGGQTIVIPNAGAIVTAVQNSVNDQIIQTRTTIDAVLSSLSALRASTLAGSIRQQALDTVRYP